MIISEKKLRFLIKKRLLSENGLTIGNVINDFMRDMENSDTGVVKLAIRKNSIIIQIIFSLLDSVKIEDIKTIFNKFYERNFKNALIANADTFIKSQEKKFKDDQKEISRYLTNFITKIKNSANGEDDNTKINLFKEAYKNFKNQLDDYIPKWAPLQFLFYNINNRDFLANLESLASNDNLFEKVTDTVWILKEAAEQEVFNKVKDYIINKAKFNVNQVNEILSDTLKSATSFESTEDTDILSGVIDDVYNYFFPSSSSAFNVAKSGSITKTIGDGIENVNKTFGIGDSLSEMFKENWESLQQDDGAELKKLLAPDTPLGQFVTKVLNQSTDKMSKVEFEKAVEQILKFNEPIIQGMVSKTARNQNITRSGQKAYKSFEFKK